MVDERDDMENDSLSNGSSHGNGEDQEGTVKVIEADEAGGATEESAASASSAGTTSAEEELQNLKREKDEIYERLLRKHADFENFRKRAEKEKRDFQMYALSELVLDLLPVMDNFERALSHPEEQGSAEYRKGVELIYRQFRDLMEKKGLRPIETLGQSFDPNFHEAILREERNDLPENTILAELQKGYFFRDKLLRPAMVKVSYKSEDTDADPEVEIIDVE